MVGRGFAHSSAFHRAKQFFDLNHEPLLKAVVDRTRDKVEALLDAGDGTG